MNTDTPETDAVWNDKNQNILEHAKKMERERDEANSANKIIQEREAELVSKYCYQKDLVKEKDAAIANLNQRLVERRESFQAQLIRIEDVWREKLTESRKDADRLYNCLLEVGVYELDEHYYVSNVLAQHEELVRNG